MMALQLKKWEEDALERDKKGQMYWKVTPYGAVYLETKRRTSIVISFH